jgi:hypothetical protein
MHRVVTCQHCEKKIWWARDRAITWADCPHCGKLMQPNTIRDKSKARRTIEDPRLGE